MALQKFDMPAPGNTCWKTGAEIAPGDPVWANNPDEVRAGLGICQAAYDEEFGPPPAPPAGNLSPAGETGGETGSGEPPIPAPVPSPVAPPKPAAKPATNSKK